MGALGDTFFWLLKMEQFEKTWHKDEQGRRTYTIAEAAESDYGRHPQMCASSPSKRKRRQTTRSWWI